ncbi:hypothetical protein [Actinomycetospora sp. NBC_00405]|uniref:hypothetical protein n=1 Tax=Actinomycetospora sp. NBC_00405 TaxID=2975952 RepID=UPI002E1FE339
MHPGVGPDLVDQRAGRGLGDAPATPPSRPREGRSWASNQRRASSPTFDVIAPPALIALYLAT